MSKKIALWNPYLDVVGGGEKHILQICNFFTKQGYELTIFWDQNIQKQLQDKLIVNIPANTVWLPKLSTFNFFQKIKLLREYDILLYVTDGSYFFSSAKKTIGFCMVPDRKLYKMTIKNKLLTARWDWICNSQFTQHYLENWGVNAKVIYPILNLPPSVNRPHQGTSLTFLTVGRFFQHLHSKRHDAAVAWFVSFLSQHPQYSTSRLILVGGLKEEDRPYYESLKKLSTNYPNVVFKTNISSQDLDKYYRRADYYLHFAGWQVNESEHPERTEHLGITPVEAMSYGCIPFCYKSGGIREVIKDHENGFTFKSIQELSQKVVEVNHDPSLEEVIRNNGRQTVEKVFSYKAFEQRMSELFA